MTIHSDVKLTVGYVAPIFQTEDIFGQSIDLSAYSGKFVLLSFFRNSACALCNLRVHQLITKYPAYEARGLNIIAVFESPVASIRHYVGKQNTPFPLIADPEARLYDLYGVETSEAKVGASMQHPLTQAVIGEAAQHGFQLTREEGSNFYRMPADFLIGADGTILRAFYSDVIGAHLPFDEIEAVIG